jgi:hypothetical protein
LGSTRKIVKFRETVENTSYTPPSPMKATPTTIASNSNDVSTASVSKAGDVIMMASSSQKEGVSTYHGRAFPVLKIYKDTIMKEVERLRKLGVLERQPASGWALLSFIIPKKDKTVCFLSDFWEVNERLVRKPFPIPKISMVLQEIEGFPFATALDCNIC